MEHRAATPSYTDLAERIEAVRERAATPGCTAHRPPEQVDVEAWDHVGDPLAEALIGRLRDRKLMGGDILATTRRLRREGDPIAEAFLADVEHLPEWADFDAMRPGASFGLRHPLGMVLSLHGALPFTYVDGGTARVMASTGRMTKPGADFRRRFWESASGFVGALDVDAMRPGGPRWEEWVRIRLLHTQIRLGILRSGRWDTSVSMPISQAATAVGGHIFGAYRIKLMEHFGARPTPDEAAGFKLMWRWIARIEGASAELLGTTDAEQLQLATRISDHLYRPTEDSRVATAAMIDGLATMKRIFPVSRRVHASLVRDLLSEDMVQTLPGRDVPAALGLEELPRADRAAATVTWVDRGLTRLVAAMPGDDETRLRAFNGFLARQLGPVAPTYRATRIVPPHDRSGT
ncbi:hypothetical protein [Nocardioides montaniterrae]